MSHCSNVLSDIALRACLGAAYYEEPWVPQARRGVLVTGSHRSGSTWLGRMLASAEELHYVQEPFNIVARQRWLMPRPDFQFLYLDDELGRPYVDGLERVVSLRYPLRSHLMHLARHGDRSMARRAVAVAAGAHRARRRGAQPLIKDPIAIFSTEWLLDRFGLQPVVLVREPVAFVGSLKERGWTFDFRHWSNQTALLERVAHGWRDEIVMMAEHPADVIAQGVLQWNVFYDFVTRLRQRRPEVTVISYEALATDPSAGVEALFRKLGLRFGAAQESAVADLTSDSRGAERSAIDVYRSTSQAVEKGRNRLTKDEQDLVLAGTAAVARRIADLNDL